jgi:peptidoglycan/xylan/chitin deacetylase (PgdA/CDA1 family)
MGQAVELTVVMYHYVRPIRGSRFPGIKGLELDDFRGQLDYIAKTYKVVRAADVVRHAKEGEPLPENAALLTFDDGYLDHFKYAFPELRRRNMSGIFFPPGHAIERREILDVNKIHYFLSQADDLAEAIRFVESEVEVARAEGAQVRSLSDLRSEFFVPNRFDGAEVNYIKRLLQFALPLELRSRLADELFRRYVSADPASFADEIYLKSENLREMIDAGMEVGSHGTRHFWMNQLSREDQALDLDESLEFLARLGLSRHGFFYCYPYGSYNATTLELLDERECACAFTTKVSRFSIGKGASLLEIPRLDTNDLPKR